MKVLEKNEVPKTYPCCLYTIRGQFLKYNCVSLEDVALIFR